MSSRNETKRRGKAKKGTHGSLTKAGKVRSSTPHIQSSFRKGTSPIKKNKYRYQKMLRGVKSANVLVR